MFFINLLKKSKQFYGLIALMFIAFVILIFFSGRAIYIKEREQLYSGFKNELALTLGNFEHRLDDVEIEIRRIANTMKELKMLKEPNPSEISAFISDFLFDHHYLGTLLLNTDKQIKINSESYSLGYRDFINMSATDLLKKIDLTNKIENINISKELNCVYILKTITNEIGQKDKTLIFFFTPELLLTYMPKNYAFLYVGGGVQWVPEMSSFPTNFMLPKEASDTGHIVVNDTKTVFYSQLPFKNSGYVLASVADTTAIKNNLFFYTGLTIFLFSMFFTAVIFLIYFRNSHILQLIDTQKATVVCLANLAEFKDNETADHLDRTKHYGTLLSKHLRKQQKYRRFISSEYLENIGFASVLHDIGKVGIPDEILKKPDRLTEEEFEIIKQHTVFAESILKDLVDKHKVNDIFFTLSYNIASYHHEKWDGTGYPKGLKEDAIPLEARIFAICDVYDALRSERIYKDAYSHEKSAGIINEGYGTHFDPDIVDAFNECAEQFKQIHDTYVMFHNEVSYTSFGNNKRELRVEWNDKLSVGIQTVDDQHKILLRKINFLIKSILEGKGDENIISTLNFLRVYSEEHFITEEKIMLENSDINLEAHIIAHNIFRKNFSRIICQVQEEGVTETTLFDIEKYLIRWLLDHIIEMDTKIKRAEEYPPQPR